MGKATFSALVAVVLAVITVGALLAFRAEEDHPADATMIDERAGVYGGVGGGLSRQGVIRVFGEPAEEDDGFAPAGESPSAVGVPQSIPGPGRVLKYKGVAFLLAPGGGTYAFIVTKAGATTRRGVSIGDSMDEARRKYGLKCIEVAGGESLLGEQDFYPSCSALLDSGTRIWFGHDPIRSIVLHPLGGSG